MNDMTVEQAIERDDLAESLATTYMSGFAPELADIARAIELGLNPQSIREAVDACYDPEEDTL